MTLRLCGLARGLSLPNGELARSRGAAKYLKGGFGAEAQPFMTLRLCGLARGFSLEP
jgi:hypothetical protein